MTQEINAITAEQQELLYQQAKERYLQHTTQESVKDAAEQFRILGDYKRSLWYLEKCQELLGYAVGNTVEFGKWDGKPIRWRVLEHRGKLRLLFAEDVITHRAYNDMRVDTSWKGSTLRAWLNSEFLEEAFSKDERIRLVSSIVKTEENPIYFTVGGQDSMDKAFLLSLDEIQRYLPAQEDLSLGQWWWLRTPGCNLLTAVSVYSDGSIYNAGVNINYADGGVRPAILMMTRG